jgi:hypothetical protein
MKKYAVIDANNIVADIIVADSVEDAELATGRPCVESTESNSAVIGLGYDGTRFEQRVIVPPTLE